MKVTEAERALSLELQELAAVLESKLERRAGKKMLFSLLIFNEEAGSRMQYISNTHRDSVLVAMRSLLSGWREDMPDIPAHEVE